jgi:hypothetical protein
LQECRSVRHQTGRIREIPQRCRLAARPLERREPFLAGLGHLREQLLQLTRQREVLDVCLYELDTKHLDLLPGELHESVANLRTTLEQRGDRLRRNNVEQPTLELEDRDLADARADELHSDKDDEQCDDNLIFSHDHASL